MKQHHTTYKKAYRQYILDTIEDDGNGKALHTDQEKIEHIFDRFNSEYGFNIERMGKHKAMAGWLSGLALNIEYNNYDVVKLAIKMGSIDENSSEKLKERVCANYWNFMANIILGFKRVQ